MCADLLESLEREEVVERVAGHNLIHPIRHGARVQLPHPELEQEAAFKK